LAEYPAPASGGYYTVFYSNKDEKLVAEIFYEKQLKNIHCPLLAGEVVRFLKNSNLGWMGNLK
jgi:hypothetical protein